MTLFQNDAYGRIRVLADPPGAAAMVVLEPPLGGARPRLLEVQGRPAAPPAGVPPGLGAAVAQTVESFRLRPAGPPGLPAPPRPALMGILNVTPDSFSDGGRYADPGAALARAEELLAEGADIVDIGGESTRPGAAPVPAAEERARVLPVIAALRLRTPALISVDTRRAEVAAAALDAGADWINDVSGLAFDPAMAALAAARGCPVVLMHMRGTPATMREMAAYGDVTAEVALELAERVRSALAAGVTPDRILIDPGIGFAKGPRECLELLARLAELRSLGLPILVGPSRKSFLGSCLDRPAGDRLHGTAAAVAAAVLAGARAIRVHDMAAMRDVALAAAAIADRARPPAGEEGR